MVTPVDAEKILFPVNREPAFPAFNLTIVGEQLYLSI